MPDAQEIEAQKKALAQARSELRVVRTDRDLLLEQLNRFKRQLFDAKSEAAGAARQKDLFFDEAEADVAQSQPLAEDIGDAEGDQVEVPAHKRSKRGRKPLDLALPREVVRHELPEGERLCPRDGAALAEIGVEVSEQLDVLAHRWATVSSPRVVRLDHLAQRLPRNDLIHRRQKYVPLGRATVLFESGAFIGCCGKSLLLHRTTPPLAMGSWT